MPRGADLSGCCPEDLILFGRGAIVGLAHVADVLLSFGQILLKCKDVRLQTKRVSVKRWSKMTRRRGISVQRVKECIHRDRGTKQL